MGTPNTAEKFWSRVALVDDNARCWLWTGRLFKGYGYFSYRGECRAHRVAFMLKHGPDSVRDVWILHHCDNRACCNPAHLYAGTHEDNMRDCQLRGRVRCKLPIGRAMELRQRAVEKNEDIYLLAAEYGITRVQAVKIAFGVASARRTGTGRYANPDSSQRRRRTPGRRRTHNDQVRDAIRSEYLSGNRRRRDVAAKFRVSQSFVKDVVADITRGSRTKAQHQD